MKNNTQKPAQVVLTYKAANSDLQKKNVTTTILKAEKKLTRLDDNHRLVRRYTFDDNGGGYLGL